MLRRANWHTPNFTLLESFFLPFARQPLVAYCTACFRIHKLYVAAIILITKYEDRTFLNVDVHAIAIPGMVRPTDSLQLRLPELFPLTQIVRDERTARRDGAKPRHV